MPFSYPPGFAYLSIVLQLAKVSLFKHQYTTRPKHEDKSFGPDHKGAGPIYLINPHESHKIVLPRHKKYF